MLGLRCRRHTCKVILITSLVWCIVDLVVLVNYSDCGDDAGGGWGCAGQGAKKGDGGAGVALPPPGKRGALKFAREVKDKELQVRNNQVPKEKCYSL